MVRRTITPVAALACAVLIAMESVPVQAAYSLVKKYEGSSFFDDWSYYGHYDNLTNGDTIFVNRSASADLAYVNSAGNAIIKVDNTTVVPYNEKRDTVRIQTTEGYGPGTLWVFDALHVPYGCSVWGAYWSQAANWPEGGEIDVFEGVNLQTRNQMALHTTAGCTATSTSSAQTGALTYNNCDSDANSNSGCTTVDLSTASYGSAFAAAGGGVWATTFSDTGISIWFFTRSAVPSDLLASNASAVPDPAGWGTPTAFYSSSSCNIGQFFDDQFIILDITLCGDWAGAPAVFNATCTGTCYLDYVLDAASYNTAYFEIASLRIYGDGTQTVTTTTGTAAASSGTTAAGSSTTSTGAASTARVPVSFGAIAGSALLATVALVAAWTL